jgi:hypothetical protein
MDKFDREELKAAFEAGKIPVSDDYIRRLDGLLRALASQYRARKVAREQDLTGQLTRLEETKSFLAGLWDIEALLCGFEEETPRIISRLSGAAQHGIDFLKIEKEQRKIRLDDPETTLFMGLRDVYVSLSGKTGISDDGPLHRFANACTKLIDVSIILPQPQSLRKALKRRATPPPLEPDPKACCVRCGVVIPGYGAHRNGERRCGRRSTVGSIGGRAAVIRAI